MRKGNELRTVVLKGRFGPARFSAARSKTDSEIDIAGPQYGTSPPSAQAGRLSIEMAESNLAGATVGGDGTMTRSPRRLNIPIDSVHSPVRK